MGRLSEMLPIAALGFIVAYFNLIAVFEKHLFNLILMGLLSVIFIALDYKLPCASSGFLYNGVWNMFVGYSITAFAYNCNFQKIVMKYPAFSHFITKHTLGIYCGHMLILSCFFHVLGMLGVQTGLFYQCVIIYLVGFVVFEIVSKIPCRWFKYIM
jgi:hypothetical protein